jgi:protein-tyrosine-phosphatase
MTTESRQPILRVLFICTRNSARSQIAEAVMTRRLQREKVRRFEVASAGSDPAESVHPLAVDALAEVGIHWGDRRPKGFADVSQTEWDVVVTVCDRARESCPTFSGEPAFAHWGLSDPASVEGDIETRRRAFRATVSHLSRRIDLLLALRFDVLQRDALEFRAQRIHAEARKAPLTAALPTGAVFRV